MKVIKIFIVGVCDNSDQQNDSLEEIINQYFKDFDLPGYVYKFTDPEKLINSNIDYDAIFLGITFKKMDGIEIAHLLRTNGYIGKIIFVSSQINYGVASYEVKAFNFVKKLVNKEKIFSILHEVREEKRREYKYLDTPNGEVKIDLNKVLYADIQKRNLCCHLENEVLNSKTLKTSFENYIGTLVYHPDFVFIPPSLIINLNQIKIMNKDNLTFKNGEVLYFPKKGYEEINRRWKNPFR